MRHHVLRHLLLQGLLPPLQKRESLPSLLRLVQRGPSGRSARRQDALQTRHAPGQRFRLSRILEQLLLLPLCYLE
jgi:hypothetical protein